MPETTSTSAPSTSAIPIDEAQEIWYRVEDQRWSVTLDPEMEIYGTRLGLYIRKFEVIRHTPKGVWLNIGLFNEDQRFVLKSANKRFACATLEEALHSYIARKNRQIRIYTQRVADAEEHKRLAQEKLGIPSDILGHQ